MGEERLGQMAKCAIPCANHDMVEVVGLVDRVLRHAFGWLCGTSDLYSLEQLSIRCDREIASEDSERR